MKQRIIIVSLADGDPDLLNAKTLGTLREAGALVLRTGKHPMAEWLRANNIRFSTLDRLYEESEDFDLLNQHIAGYLIAQANEQEIVYAVTDAVTDRTVKTLMSLKPDNTIIDVVPGTSTYDLRISDSLPSLPDMPVVVIPAAQMAEGFQYDPNLTLLVTEIDNEILAGQVKICLSEMLDDDKMVMLLCAGGKNITIPLWQIDRHPEIDHRTAVVVPGSDFMNRERFVMNDLTAMMDTLRSPSGCPWDKEQTHDTLRRYMIEEAWECVACIEEKDADHLCEELGDLLFQVVFHASVGKAFDEFTINDVISSICAKMIRRHPHVFGTMKLDDAESVRAEWEKIKQEETGHLSVLSSMDDVSDGLPSLLYAAKTIKKFRQLKNLGLSGEKMIIELRRTIDRIENNAQKEEDTVYGDLLLLCAALCQLSGRDGELLLHQAVDRMKDRLKKAESIAKHNGKSLESLTFEELCVYLKHVEGEIE